MSTRSGYPFSQWDAARDEVREILIRTAGAGTDLTYTDLCRQISAIRIEPHDYALPHLLGEVLREEHEAGRPLLTVLVVYKDGDKMPGPGFFALAEELGYDCSDRLRFWIEHLNLVHAFWAAPQS